MTVGIVDSKVVLLHGAAKPGIDCLADTFKPLLPSRLADASGSQRAEPPPMAAAVIQMLVDQNLLSSTVSEKQKQKKW